MGIFPLARVFAHRGEAHHRFYLSLREAACDIEQAYQGIEHKVAQGATCIETTLSHVGRLVTEDDFARPHTVLSSIRRRYAPIYDAKLEAAALFGEAHVQYEKMCALTRSLRERIEAEYGPAIAERKERRRHFYHREVYFSIKVPAIGAGDYLSWGSLGALLDADDVGRALPDAEMRVRRHAVFGEATPEGADPARLQKDVAMYVAREAYWRAQVLAKDLRFFVSAQGRVGIFRCFNSRTLSTIESALSHYRPRR